MESALLIVYTVVITLVYICVTKFIAKTSRKAQLPPGSRGLPLVGNVLDLPRPGQFEAHHWAKHKDLYGNISSVTVFGQTLVIINDAKLAQTILNDRSAKHSSRSKMTFAGEMVGWDKTLSFLPYNDQLRSHRKKAHLCLKSEASIKVNDDIQEIEVGHFLLHLLRDPDRLVEHIQKQAGSVIVKVVYGYTAEQFKPDPLLSTVRKVVDEFGIAAKPGAFVVDLIPILKYIPDWFPGASFKTTAKQWRSNLESSVEDPAAFVEHQMAGGKDNTSFLSQLMQKKSLTDEEVSENKWLAASLYAAGADTTVSAITTFFLALTLFPEAQKKAQHEIDEVIGTERLPTLSDRQSLPYVNALVKEVLRWHPVGPMCLPHTTSQDDVIDGLLIPKGAMILPNIWQICHDPALYHDPMAFKPERFFGPEAETDPGRFVFGFGRRICPAQTMSDKTLFLNMAQTLAVFDVGVKEGGEMPKAEFTSGVVSHPKAFEGAITPRSSEHRELIESIERMHPWQQSDADTLASL
ncbi:O-methylsterigmatocystin oxidoreductase [Fusarium agapanthi]|uniref:O-methylsterigmatocystin oxidoreductase n=1 Tax=Fusarium agapanthi TaxID=1803897 RepID=A0A9P5EFB3_9HYPO|nr:O-methylsterigmatocystin oxidoreductase [Fusarium agapanthi]